MATFVSLISLTHRGEEDIRHTVQRANAFRETAEKAGAKVKDVYWTLGNYDGVLIFEAPDAETATSLILNLGSKGNVRTQTLRAFDSDEIKSIVDGVASPIHGWPTCSVSRFVYGVEPKASARRLATHIP